MLKKVLLVFLISFMCSGRCQRTKNMNETEAEMSPLPELYRDHVYYSLSDKGKEAFYAANIHPDCKAKKGRCVARAQCIGHEMLYISRVCYKRDLVCCYDNSIKFPEVAWKQYTPPPPQVDTRDVYIEPPVEP